MADAAGPSDAELLQAIIEVKAANPEFGVPRIRTTLKESRQWEVSEKRIKKVLQTDTGAAAPEKAAAGNADGAGAEQQSKAEAESAAPGWVEERPSARGYFSLCLVEDGAALAGDAAAAGAEESRARLLMFGGEHYDGDKNLFYNQLYLLHPMGSSWHRASFAAGHQTPPARSAHQMCVFGGAVYLFGGEWSSANGSKFKLLDDLWRLPFPPSPWRWERIGGGKDGPSGRSGHRMVVVKDKLVVYGGMGESKYYGDLHVFDLSKGQWVSKAVQMQLKKAGAASPGPRSGFAMWTDGEEWVYVLGGTKEVGSKGGTETLSDLWRLSMSALAWEKMTQTGPGPRGRSGMAIAWVGSEGGGGRLLSFGGVSDEEREEEVEAKGKGGKPVTKTKTVKVSTFHADLLALQINGHEAVWSVVLPGEEEGEGAAGGRARAPSGRRNAQAAWVEGRLHVVGGLREEGPKERERCLDDAWVYTPAGDGGAGGWAQVQAASDAGEWHETDESGDEEGEEGEGEGGAEGMND